MNSELKRTAYNLLARREQSAKELKSKLAAKGYETEEIDLLLEKLQSADLQSDIRYADLVVRSRVNKGYGWLYIQQELKQKGVAGQIVNELCRNSEIDWYLQAELAYNKRFGNQATIDDKDKAKKVRFLQYRGFTLEQALCAIDAFKTE